MVHNGQTIANDSSIDAAPWSKSHDGWLIGSAHAHGGDPGTPNLRLREPFSTNRATTAGEEAAERVQAWGSKRFAVPVTHAKVIVQVYM